MNLIYHNDLEIADDYIRIDYREYTLTIYQHLMFKHISVLDFQKMCKTISWSLPDDEELIDVAQELVSAIADSPRDDRAKKGLRARVFKMLYKRGLDLYA